MTGAVGACSSASSSGGAEGEVASLEAGTDGATHGPPSPVDGGADARDPGPRDSAATSDGAVEGGACDPPTPVEGGACNALSPAGSYVSAMCLDGPVPTAIGGAIVDGTYVLTGFNNYGCPDGGLGPLFNKAVKVVCGSSWQVAGNIQGNGAYSTDETVTIGGTNLTITTTCPGEETATWGYTATPMTLTMYSVGADGSGEEEIWTRQ